MSPTSSPTLTQSESFGKKLRNTAVGTLFALVLLIPRLLHLRRNAHSWRLFCILLGISGAALVILPLGLGNNNYVYAIVGMAMFIAAILLPPAKPAFSTDDKARELGALVVVNGGRFKLAEASSFIAQLFVGAEHVRVLDPHLKCFLEIPIGEITSAQAEESHDRWFLRINWADKTAVFSYRGVFAEHLARVAESTLHSVMRPSLPVIPQARAASA
jgi:hypothetical protein